MTINCKVEVINGLGGFLFDFVFLIESIVKTASRQVSKKSAILSFEVNNSRDFFCSSSEFKIKSVSGILKSPIIPYIKTKGLGVTTISRFDAATKLYQKVAAKLPNPDVEIKVIHQGWEFYEEKIKNLSDLLSVEPGMGIQIIIYDTFEKEKTYYD